MVPFHSMQSYFFNCFLTFYRAMSLFLGSRSVNWCFIGYFVLKFRLKIIVTYILLVLNLISVIRIFISSILVYFSCSHCCLLNIFKGTFGVHLTVFTLLTGSVILLLDISDTVFLTVRDFLRSAFCCSLPFYYDRVSELS